MAYFMVGSLSIVDRQHHEDARLRPRVASA
jgi:hypothetical protein